MPKFGTKNGLLGYFWARILKSYCHIWNQHPRICLIAKICEKTKMPKFGTKGALLLSYLKSAPWNFSNCKIRWWPHNDLRDQGKQQVHYWHSYESHKYLLLTFFQYFQAIKDTRPSMASKFDTRVITDARVKSRFVRKRYNFRKRKNQVINFSRDRFSKKTSLIEFRIQEHTQILKDYFPGKVQSSFFINYSFTTQCR